MHNPSCFSLAPASAGRWILTLLLLLVRLSASAQAIAPQFFGINYWNMKAGTNALTNPNAALTSDLKTADLKWLRIGGHRFDTDAIWKTPAQYVAAIQYARSLGGEPLVQVPIGLTKDELSAFVTYFKNNNITVTYWAIGNEPDPSGTNANGQENATVWSADGLANEFGYTYSQWVSQYKTLAIRLKNDLPGCKLVGPDFRLFYEPLISDYYQKFLNDVGSKYYGGVPLLDYISFHFYADRTESVMQARFAILKTLIDNVNAGARTQNGSAAIRLAINEVNAFGTSPAGELKPWDFGAGQFLVMMAKQAMQQSALCFIPWSIYESGANQGGTDYSLYSNDGAGSVPVARRSTMWHLAMLSNYRQANIMNGTQNSQANNIVVLGMRGPAGYTVLVLNTTKSASYSYRASLDNVQRGPEAVQIALEGYGGMTRQLAGTIGPRTTHLYHLDASGNVLAQLSYATGDAAPKQQLSFDFVNRSTGGYARPLAGLPANNITQYTGADHSFSSLQWLLKPAAPGYFYILNQYTGLAMRPQGSISAAYMQEDQVMTQEALSIASLGLDYLQWSIEYTGAGGFYRLINKASGKCLRPLGGSAAADINLVQHTKDATMTSEQWRFDQTNANNTLAQARPSAALATAAVAPATELEIYPNPVANMLAIKLATEAGQATLHDLTGRCFLTQALGRTSQLDVQALPPGVYLLTVTTGQGSTCRRIVKE